MAPYVKHSLVRHAAYVRPRRAAVHGTVCGACFNDVCMRFMGLVMFFFYNFRSFSSSIIIISCVDCVTAHITHFNLIYFKDCKPACTAPRSNIKFCVR